MGILKRWGQPRKLLEKSQDKKRRQSETENIFTEIYVVGTLEIHP